MSFETPQENIYSVYVSTMSFETPQKNKYSVYVSTKSYKTPQVQYIFSLRINEVI